MAIKINTKLVLRANNPVDCLLQFDAAALPDQSLEILRRNFSQRITAGFPAQDYIGERSWIRFEGELEIDYEASVRIDRINPILPDQSALPPHALPRETVPYLFDSRYCPASKFQSFALSKFVDIQGGARIAAISDWIASHVSYEAGVSDASTGAQDTFLERRGICRDFAHLLIALARASSTPARFVSCYAPGVEPQDFHAVAEVFLADPTRDDGGYWHIVDATGMASPEDTVKIGVGRDAADVSFMTSFGPVDLIEKSVKVIQE
ncbi:MAG: transglutaminase family protein [Pseudomonadota bacterium]